MSNWKKLKGKLSSEVTKDGIINLSKRIADDKKKDDKKAAKVEQRRKNLEKASGSKIRKPEQYVGLDCEMVGLGDNGKKSALARACLVDYDGNVIYDNFVRPKGFVTDFRTKYSGVRKKDLRKGEAISFEKVMDISYLFLPTVFRKILTL